MAKLIMAWLFGAAVFALGNVFAATPERPTDEDTIGTRAEITLIQAILDDEDEDLQDDEDLQEDQDDPDGEGDAQDDLEDEDDQEDSSREWTTPT